VYSMSPLRNAGVFEAGLERQSMAPTIAAHGRNTSKLAKIKQQRRSFRTFLKVGAGVFSANFRRVGQRRDVVRFHPRVPRRARPAVHTTATAAPVQDAGSLRRGTRRCRHGAVPHVRAAARHLDTLRHMAGARPRCLRALRKQAQPDWTNRHSPVPLIAGERNVSGRHPVAAGALVRGHRCRVPSPHVRGCNRVAADRLPQRAGRRREAL
jgi:hypothetical protein